jgi:hypothetical protein
MSSVEVPSGFGLLDCEAPWRALRVAVLDPELGIEPHSQLRDAMDACRWAAETRTEMSARMLDRCSGSEHPEFWAAVAHEVAGAGRVPRPSR